MVCFYNVFSQNGALITISWGPASKSPLNSNHTQTTGMLNMKTCQLQKLWPADSKDLDVGWANGQEMDCRLARCYRGSRASLAQKSPSISLSCQILIFPAYLSSRCCALFLFLSFFFLLCVCVFLFLVLLLRFPALCLFLLFACLSCYEET